MPRRIGRYTFFTRSGCWLSVTLTSDGITEVAEPAEEPVTPGRIGHPGNGYQPG